MKKLITITILSLILGSAWTGYDKRQNMKDCTLKHSYDSCFKRIYGRG